ncbi:MAG: cytochrome c oxidase subunit II [Deltaproteobacteria bacterium]|nr:cytochrome c oxidase subunit II [Deltaproteobacteria bacterium]
MEKLQYGIGLMPDLSTHGHGIDQLIYFLHGFMLLLFVGWGIFLAYTLIRFRARAGHKANYESLKSKLPKYAEVAVVAFEVFLLVGLSMPVWNSYKSDPPDEKEALRVRVVGQQFAWYIHYAGEDKKFGRTDSKLISDFNPLGIDSKDPASEDDFYSLRNFNLPVGKPIIAEITSKDVIHSFGVPVLRVKQDATPGITVPIWFTAKETGEFEIICSQLCGIGHSTMGGKVHVQKPEDFKKWWDEQERPYKKSTASL